MGWVERFGELLILAPSPFSPQTNLQTPQTKTNPFSILFLRFVTTQCNHTSLTASKRKHTCE